MLRSLTGRYLIKEWQAFLRYAWSVRFTVLSILCALTMGCEQAWPNFAETLPLTPGELATGTVFFSSASILASIFIQRRLHGKK